MPRLRFACKTSICFAAHLLTIQTFAQAFFPIRAPGDLTLHGDPDCGYWMQVEPKEKETWLNAILAPINMVFVHKEKPVVDKFSVLPSLAPAAKYVDTYCDSRRHEKAMNGAMRYFEELTSQSGTR